MLVSVVSAVLWAGALQATDFTVTNTNSSGAGSLYQAISDANNAPGADRIVFNIPGAGVHKINVSQNPLPTISDSLTIDGYTQPGAKANTLTRGDNAVILIQLDGTGGSSSEPTAGLMFSGANSDFLVRGLCITGFSDAIEAGSVHSAVVVGDFIGVLPDGETALANRIAVTHVSQIGGVDAASRNVISGNDIGLAGPRAEGAVIQGNYIGTNASGTKAIRNTTGISMEESQSVCIGGQGDVDLSKTIIGGTGSGAGNLISGNDVAIVIGSADVCARNYVLAFRVHGLRIQGNLIGVQSDGISPLANETGVRMVVGSDNIIGGSEAGAGNVIAFAEIGIAIWENNASVHNQILSNSIYANRIGIDLGNNGLTANDAGDADDGPNNLQNYPVIQRTDIANGNVTITGTLNSSANSEFTLQYFAESLRPGQTYLGNSSVTTDANGNASFSASFPVADTSVAFNMTATSQDGNTSEFAQNSARLRNISTRGLVQTSWTSPDLIAGFIVEDGTYVVIRALAASLRTASGARLSYVDPIMEIHDSSGNVIVANDNWRDASSVSTVQSLGLAPTDDTEAALGIQLNPGSYTAVVRGRLSNPGDILVEVYDIQNLVDPDLGELANLSTRAFVGGDDAVMIAGTILDQIAGSTRIVVRALGPSLVPAGVGDALADPTLELHDSQGALIAANDNWRDGQPNELTAAGLAPSNDAEAAMFVRLSAGAYTAIVRGKNDSTGVALVELYNLH